MSVRVARRVRNHASRRCWFELDELVAEPAVERSAGSDPDLRFAIDDFLAELPANYRAAIVSCYLEGLTHEEAAGRLRCPVGTVRSRLARGRAILKKRLIGPDLRRRAGSSIQQSHFEQMPAPAVVAPQLVDSHRPGGRQTCRGRAPPSYRSNPDRRTCNGSDPNHDNLQARGGGFVGCFLRYGGLGCSRIGCPDTRPASQETPAVSVSSPEIPTSPSLIAYEPSAQERRLSPRRRAARNCRSPTTYPRSSSNVEPKVGATDVDPALKEIRVTFSKKMTDKSWSWPTGNKYAAPKVEGGKSTSSPTGGRA